MYRMWRHLSDWWTGRGEQAARPVPRAAIAAPEQPVPWQAIYERWGIPRSLHYPSTTLARILDQTTDRFAALPAVVYGDLKWTYAELLAQVNRAAGGLAQLGVRKGDRVLSTLPNCPELIVSFFAVQKLGAVLVNVGPLIGADDVAKLIEMTAPRLLIGLDLQAANLAAAGEARQIPRICVSLSGYQSMWIRVGYRYKLWQTRRSDPRSACEMTFAQVLEQAPPRPPTLAPEPDDVAVLQPTGGTTGTLKVAQLTHRNLLANAMQVSVWGRLRDGQETVLGVLPMFHAYGLTLALLMPVLCGGTMLPLTRFRLGQLLDMIASHRPTVAPLVPAILHAMCDELERRPRPDVTEALGRAMVLSGAAPLAPALAQRFEKLAGTPILQGYGLTEASPVTHSNPPRETRAESIGIPLPDTHTRIADLHDPKVEAPHGEAGELLISGPQIFAGYFNDPHQTARMLSRDAAGRVWLHTGDVVRVDSDGFFYIIDRCKDMINRAGEKVWPARVERVLLMHPQVADVAVIGRPDPLHNESVAAILAMRAAVSDEPALLEELRALCREHLGPHEMPSHFEFVEAIPRSALGKLLKYQLRPPAPAAPPGATPPVLDVGEAA